MDNKGRNRIRTVTAHAYQPEPQESKIWIPTTLEGEDNEDNRDLVEFTIALSEALHRTGLAAPTVEQTAAKVGEIFDVNVRVFSVPTATIYSFGDEESVLSKETHLLNSKTPAFNFHKVIKVKQIADQVFSATMSPSDGTENLKKILKEPPIYDGLWEIIGFVFVAAAICYVYRVGWPDLLAALVLSVGAGVISQWSALGPAYCIIAGFTLATMSVMIHNLIYPINIFRVAIAGIAQSLPGLTLTQSFLEISTGHIVSGSARALYGLLKLLSIAYGIIFGAVVWGYLYTIEIHDNTSIHTAFFPLFVTAGGIGFSIDLQVPMRHWWITIVTVTIAAAVDRWLSPVTNDVISPLVGGLLVTMTSNVYSKIFPPHVAIMPTICGIVMLVPGGYGLRGMFALAIDGDATGAVTVMFNVLLISTELSVAVILGNILIPPPGRDEGIGANFYRKLNRDNVKRLWNKIRGEDEDVGVQVTRTTDSDDEDLESRSSDS